MNLCHLRKTDEQKKRQQKSKKLGLILKVAKDTTLNENYIKSHSNTLFLRVQRHDQIIPVTKPEAMETSLIGRVRLVVKLLVVEHLSRPWNILYNNEGFHSLCWHKV